MSNSQKFDFVIWVAIFGAFWGVIGALIANRHGRGGTGFLVSFLLGPFGVVIACFLKPTPEFLQQKADQTAWAAGAPTSVEREYQDALRKWAIGEAMRRDPELATGTDSETLARLDATVEQLMREVALSRQRDEVLKDQSGPAAVS